MRTSILRSIIRDGARPASGVSESFSRERPCHSTAMRIRLHRCMPAWISERIIENVETSPDESCGFQGMPRARLMAPDWGIHRHPECKSDQGHHGMDRRVGAAIPADHSVYHAAAKADWLE